jgi:hypothetical protein
MMWVVGSYLYFRGVSPGASGFAPPDRGYRGRDCGDPARFSCTLRLWMGFRVCMMCSWSLRVVI